MRHLWSILTFLLAQQSVDAQMPSWAWAQSSSGDLHETAAAVVSDSQGNTYVAGTFTSETASFGGISINHAGGVAGDIFIVKYDPNGGVEWAQSIGGTSYDEVMSVTIDDLDNIYMVGQSTSDLITFGGIVLNPPNSYYEMFAAKVDPSGTFLWANTIRGVGGFGYEGARAVVHDPLGFLYVSGYFVSDTVFFAQDTLVANPTFGNSNDGFLLKYDDSGNQIWARGLLGTWDDDVSSIAVDAAGSLYAVGSYRGLYTVLEADTLLNLGAVNLRTAFFAKYDSDGTLQWAQNYGGNGLASFAALVTLPSGGVELLGNVLDDDYYLGTIHLVGPSGRTFLAGYNPMGEPMWAVLGESGSVPKDSDENGDLYFTGSYSGGSITLGAYTLTDGGLGTAIYAYGADSTGTVKWAISATGGDGTNDTPHDLAVDDLGNAFCVGHFQSNQCVFGTTTAVNSSPGETEAFIAKVSGVSTTSIGSVTSEPMLLVYPNPSLGELTVDLDNIILPRSIDLLNTEGRTVWHYEHRLDLNSGKRITIRGVEPGAYLLRVRCESSVHTAKVVLQ